MKKNIKREISDWLRWIVFALSVALIVFISVDTFMQKPFLTNPVYMRFQLWVCIIFIIEFFAQVFLAERHWRFFWRNIVFLLVSIPYLNIITHYNVQLGEQELYFVRFIPLVRAAYAMALVISYVSTSRIVDLVVQSRGHDHRCAGQSGHRRRQSARGVALGHGGYNVPAVHGLSRRYRVEISQTSSRDRGKIASGRLIFTIFAL